MAILSKGIKLKAGEAEISGLISIPDMGGDPEQVDVTTLADASKKYIAGLVDYGSLDFEFNYESGAAGNYAVLGEKEDAETEWTVELPDGAKFVFTGTCKRKLNAAAVNEAIKFTLTIYLASEIEFTEAAGA